MRQISVLAVVALLIFSIGYASAAISTSSLIKIAPITLKCADGTPYNSCSKTLPKYCKESQLYDNCGQCGCPTGYICQTNGTCIMSLAKIATIPTTITPVPTTATTSTIPSYKSPPKDSYENCKLYCEKYYTAYVDYYQKCKNECSALQPLPTAVPTVPQPQPADDYGSCTDACYKEYGNEPEAYKQCLVQKCYVLCKEACYNAYGDNQTVFEQCVKQKCLMETMPQPQPETKPVPQDEYSVCKEACWQAYGADQKMFEQCVEQKCLGRQPLQGPAIKPELSLPPVEYPKEKGCPECPKVRCPKPDVKAEACEDGEYKCNPNAGFVLICVKGHWQPDKDYADLCVQRLITIQPTVEGDALTRPVARPRVQIPKEKPKDIFSQMFGWIFGRREAPEAEGIYMPEGVARQMVTEVEISEEPQTRTEVVTAEAPPEEAVAVPVADCYSTDSDDYSGAGKYERGTTTGLAYNALRDDSGTTVLAERYGTFTDRCTYNDTAVQEYFCYQTPEGDVRAAVNYPECEYGCENGACRRSGTARPAGECSSTDADNSPNVRGTTSGLAYNSLTDDSGRVIQTDQQGTFTDRCSGGGTSVMEFSCITRDGRNRAAVNYPTCTYGCVEGRCVESCVSDDPNEWNGEGKYVRGTTRGIANNAITDDTGTVRTTNQYGEFTDRCSPSGGLTEFFCYQGADGVTRAAVNYPTCEYGCDDGACRRSSCESTDSDNNPNVRGTTNGMAFNALTDDTGTTRRAEEWGHFTDRCTGDGQSVMEFQCYQGPAGQRAAVNYPICQWGCENGACHESSCSSTDPDDYSGEGKYVRGTTRGLANNAITDDSGVVRNTGQWGTFSDRCLPDGVSLMEYYCHRGADGVLRAAVNYPRCGAAGCSNGACNRP